MALKSTIKKICRVIGKLHQEEVDYDETFNPITRFQTFKVSKQRMLSPSDGCRDIDLFLFMVSCPRMTLLFMYISRNTYRAEHLYVLVIAARMSPSSVMSVSSMHCRDKKL
jgi:hypothetical protein